MGRLQCKSAAYSAHEKATPHAPVKWTESGLIGEPKLLVAVQNSRNLGSNPALKAPDLCSGCLLPISPFLDNGPVNECQIAQQMQRIQLPSTAPADL